MQAAQKRLRTGHEVSVRAEIVAVTQGKAGRADVFGGVFFQKLGKTGDFKRRVGGFAAFECLPECVIDGAVPCADGVGRFNPGFGERLAEGGVFGGVEIHEGVIVVDEQIAILHSCLFLNF